MLDCREGLGRRGARQQDQEDGSTPVCIEGAKTTRSLGGVARTTPGCREHMFNVKVLHLVSALTWRRPSFRSSKTRFETPRLLCQKRTRARVLSRRYPNYNLATDASNRRIFSYIILVLASLYDTAVSSLQLPPFRRFLDRHSSTMTKAEHCTSQVCDPGCRCAYGATVGVLAGL